MSVNPTRPSWLDDTVWPFAITTLHVDGVRIACTDVGAGRPLVFLNAPQWSLIWRDVILRLQDRYRCITLDPPGLGLSDRIAPERQHLGTVRDATVALVDHLQLHGAVLVVHDLGGLAGLAAAAERPDAFDRLVAVNTFGWRPQGLLLPVMLRVFGSGLLRRADTATRALPLATSGPFGVGRRMDAASRLAYRRAFDRPAAAAMHRYFADAAHNADIHRQADDGLELLALRPALTVFGAWGDYLRFGAAWRRRLPDVAQVRVRRALHFPMNDDPAGVAEAISTWDADVSRAAA